MYIRTYARIDLDAIEHNFDELKKKVPEGVKAAAIIKANAYGHGSVQVADLLKDKADYFGVAMLEEGIELRRHGIKNPILILSYTDPSLYEDLINYDISQAIFTYDAAAALSAQAVKLGKKAHVHFAVDTGMSRIGVRDDESGVKLIKDIAALPGLDIQGIFSHYACADMKDKTVKNEQTARFVSFTDAVEKAGVHLPIKHLCNSAGTIEINKTFDMVRMGISLYGLEPSDEVDLSATDLHPAMEFISHVIYVKTLDAGCGISYSHVYHTTKATRIATICAGYADGYPRALTNKGRVIINGHYAPIVGKVCMDQFMVDVSGIENVNTGDEAVLFGRRGELTLTPEEIGAMSESFNYEVICGVARRVPRVYYRNGKEVETVNYLY